MADCFCRCTLACNVFNEQPNTVMWENINTTMMNAAAESPWKINFVRETILQLIAALKKNRQS